MIDRAYLETHYQGILERNEEKILAGGTVDPRLTDAAVDVRFALVLLLRISNVVGKKVQEVCEELRAVEPDLYLYPQSDYHITVMDLLKGEAGRTLPENLEAYKRAIAACTGKIGPFWIKFDGLTASDGAVMVRGYYEEELQNLRVMLREELGRQGLDLQERYETISSHITIARVQKPLINPQKLIAFVEKPHPFGIMQVTEVELCFHNWYDTKKQTICKYEL